MTPHADAEPTARTDTEPTPSAEGEPIPNTDTEPTPEADAEPTPHTDVKPTPSADIELTADIELMLPARAENVAIVRHAIGALGEAIEIDAQTLSDIRLAVTEACTNVVVHAYPDGQEGPLEVLATLGGERLTVVVRDEGKGIAARTDSPGLGLGLPLIASLAESVQLGHGNERRTEVCMTFSLSDSTMRS